MIVVRGEVCRAAALGVFSSFLFFASFISTHAQNALPAPWAAQDIGSPSLTGASSLDQSSGVFTVDAGGTDIWGTTDQFHFVYQTLAGDGTITARVNSLAYANGWSKAGVMIRSSLDADAAHGFALVSADRGMAFQRRAIAGGLSTHTAGPSGVAPEWVRLARVGTTVTAAVSADGVAWTTIGSDSIALGATAYVGLATTSHNSWQTTTAVVSNVWIAAAPSLPSGMPAPAPQQHADIGSPAIPGSASYRDGVHTVSGAGRDVWDASDEFHYVYQPVTGDVDVTVRVQSVEYAHRWSKAGVMIRERLTGPSAHAFAAISAGSGYLFQRRPVEGGLSVHTGSAGAAPGWVRLKRTGALITAYRSSDGVSWTIMGSDSFSMAETVYVGLAVTSHNTSLSSTAVMDRFSITAAQTPVNAPPAVTLMSPSQGASFTAPGTVAFSASASDSDGTIARVEFYNGSTLLNADTSAPYSFSWGNVAAGTYSVRAVAFDNSGASASSSTATITVGSANAPPTVALTSPANGASFTAPATVTLSATASDSNGTIARVEFYNGSTLLNSDTAAPYSFSWSSVPAGTYGVRAVAYDNAGASASSSTATITVGSANAPPTVSLTSPANGASFTAPATVTLSATASDSNGTIARVEFYNGSTLLNSDTAAPYSFSWSNVPAGTYAIRAVAYDNAGASASSAISTIVVSAVLPPPTAVVFTASTDHATQVTSYLLEIFANGANPSTATPVASSDLGKPVPATNGDITVNRATLFSALAPGTYIMTVSSIGANGKSPSAPLTFTR